MKNHNRQSHQSILASEVYLQIQDNPTKVGSPTEIKARTNTAQYNKVNVSPTCIVIASSSLVVVYTGLAKLYRLKFIADHCPPLRLDALRTALNYVMTTYNTNLYQQIYRKLQEAIAG
ncbi:hypothetical protein DPMN_026946 [Dreissena polymorpha]|uniref:Uncharacterized protein n=1 Tax=Dreissena polymorpha TaxID=45954 RepID=A0A9D4RDZ1_DREPO|nr:hypothetical protein DPMN_026946 [Dreissena polymorpha]